MGAIVFVIGTAVGWVLTAGIKKQLGPLKRIISALIIGGIAAAVVCGALEQSESEGNGSSDQQSEQPVDSE